MPPADRQKTPPAMGQGACQCDTKKDQESTINEPPRFDPEVVQLPSGGSAVARSVPITPKAGEGIGKLQGSWRRQADDEPMGEICSGAVMWHESYAHPPSGLRIVNSGDVEMELIGQFHIAVYEEGPPARLRWSDGEVWIRVAVGMRA